MNAEFNNLKAYGFSVDSASTAYMMLHIHNGGYFKKNGRVDQAKMRQMSTNTNAADFDPGTTDNYVTTVINVARDCFGL